MLSPIRLKATDISPLVIFDQRTNEFIIRGRSIMEDAHDFFVPLIEWIIAYCQNPNPSTELELDLEYLNSASTRKLLNLVVELEKILPTENTVRVIWVYEENDDVMKERGEEFESVVELPFVLKEIEEK